MILLHLRYLSLRGSIEAEIYAIYLALIVKKLDLACYNQRRFFPSNFKKSKIMQEYIDFFSNNPMLSVAWVAIAAMLIHSLVKDKISGVKTITAQEATLLINKQDAIVVDVRSEEEFKKGHIVNSKNITLSQIEKGNVTEIEKHKETPIIVVCDSGARATTAANKLVKADFKQVNCLLSGMGGWASANLPTTKR